MEKIRNYYLGLIDAQRTIWEECSKDTELLQMQCRSHNQLNDLSIFLDCINDKPEKYCLELAIQEYQYALSAISNAQIRNAYSSLRLTLELVVSTAFFSGHLVYFKQWSNSDRDITWHQLMDGDKGVFSAPFMKAFSGQLFEYRKEYLVLAETVYRECSEFVHGNPSAYKLLEEGIAFDKEAYIGWHAHAGTVFLVCIFVLTMRYLAEFDHTELDKLEATLISNLGHIEEVQQIFEKAGE